MDDIRVSSENRDRAAPSVAAAGSGPVEPAAAASPDGPDGKLCRPFSLADLPWRAIAEVRLHPTQIKLLKTFAADPEGKWSPTELHDEFDMPLGVVSYHVNVLHEMALLKLVGLRQVRGASEHFYKIIKEPTPERPKPKDKTGRNKKPKNKTADDASAPDDAPEQ